MPLSSDFLFLALSAAAAAIFGWGLAQLLIGLFRRGDPLLEERLAAEARHELQAIDRRLLIRRQDADLPTVLADVLFLQQLAVRIRQAFPGTRPTRFLAATGLIAVALAALFTYLRSPVEGVVAGLLVVLAAWGAVNIKYANRQRIMADQLMDALDFLARVLRAGHSLSTGFQMIGDELPEPLAAEFRRTADQVSLGQPIDQAMLDMAARVDNVDCAFFVTSVIIQRQTGGDLAALLDNISSVIRARIRLQQHARALTAEARFSGYLLTGLPPALFVIIWFMNPQYASLLINTNMGRMMILVAAVMVILGQFAMKRITAIRV